jgi:hypothetical protein
MADKKIHELPLADTIGENDIILIGNPSTGALKKATRTLLESYAKAYADGLVTGLLDDRGNWNPGSGAWPDEGGSGVDGAIKKGDVFYLTADGTLTGPVEVNQGDSLRALVDDPGQDAESWAVMDKGMVLQTLGQTLARGNSTDEHDIVVIEGDRLVVGSNRAGVGKGTFDNGTSGDKGVSLFCAVGKELNFQGGILRKVEENDPNFKPSPILSQSSIEYKGLSFEGLTNVSPADPITNNSNFVFTGDFQALFDAAYPNSSAYRVYLYDVSNNLLGILKYDSANYNIGTDETTLYTDGNTSILAGATKDQVVKLIGYNITEDTLLPAKEVDRRLNTAFSTMKVLLPENETIYELPINTLLMYIAIYNSDSGGVKIGTSLDSDDIVSDQIIDKATYTINEYFSGATTLYFIVPANARIIIYKL